MYWVGAGLIVLGLIGIIGWFVNDFNNPGLALAQAFLIVGGFTFIWVAQR